MIFNLNGTLIDTTQIQTVSDIKTDGAIYGHYFKIEFIGGNRISYDLFNLGSQISLKTLESIHKQVIDFWKQDQSKIPTIKF